MISCLCFHSLSLLIEEPINGGPGLLPALNDLDINDGQREEPRHHHRDGLAGKKKIKIK